MVLCWCLMIVLVFDYFACEIVRSRPLLSGVLRVLLGHTGRSLREERVLSAFGAPARCRRSMVDVVHFARVKV